MWLHGERENYTDCTGTVVGNKPGLLELQGRDSTSCVTVLPCEDDGELPD